MKGPFVIKCQKRNPLVTFNHSSDGGAYNWVYWDTGSTQKYEKTPKRKTFEDAVNFFDSKSVLMDHCRTTRYSILNADLEEVAFYDEHGERHNTFEKETDPIFTAPFKIMCGPRGSDIDQDYYDGASYESIEDALDCDNGLRDSSNNLVSWSLEHPEWDYEILDSKGDKVLTLRGGKFIEDYR